MQAIVAAALAGFLATPHCAGMCGGFATACARPRAGLFAWHAGRLATYAVLGVAGRPTSATPFQGRRGCRPCFQSGLLVWFAAVLAGVAPQPSARLPGLARAGVSSWPPARHTCPLPLRHRHGPAALRDGVRRIEHLPSPRPTRFMARAMLAFGAATVPGLTVLSVGVQRFALRGPWSRRAVAAIILVFGIWTVAQRSLNADRAQQHGHPAVGHEVTH
jgi:sulfite exporter TauE/SafE